MIAIEILDGPWIDGFLPGGVAGIAYNAELIARNARLPVVWAIASGALPPGFALDGSTGVVTGTAHSPGEFAVSVALTDALGLRTHREFRLSIALPFDPCADYEPEPTSGATFRLGGDDAEYGNVTQATDGTFHLCNRIL